MSQYEFTPYDVEEKSFEPLPPAKYRAALSSYQTLGDNGAPLTSQAGNRMIKLVVQVYPPNGNPRDVFDWLVDTEGAAWKTKAFMGAVGQDYLRGKLNLEAAKGVTVEVDLGIGDPYTKDGKTYRNNKINGYKSLEAPGEVAFPGGNVPNSGLPF